MGQAKSVKNQANLLTHFAQGNPVDVARLFNGERPGDCAVTFRAPAAYEMA
jgi:hypothetical protein